MVYFLLEVRLQHYSAQMITQSQIHEGNQLTLQESNGEHEIIAFIFYKYACIFTLLFTCFYNYTLLEPKVYTAF